MATVPDIIKGIRAVGEYSTLVASESEARELLKRAMPDALELEAATAGEIYPKAPPGCKKWFQLQPPEPAVGNDRPHFKYENWTHGKKGRGGSWGHIEF